MTDSVEKIEFLDDESLDQHNEASHNCGDQSNDVHSSKDIENEVAEAGTGSLEETHSGCSLGSLFEVSCC